MNTNKLTLTFANGVSLDLPLTYPNGSSRSYAISHHVGEVWVNYAGANYGLPKDAANLLQAISFDNPHIL